MSASVTTAPAFECHYDPIAALLHAHWHGPVSEEALRQHYHEALTAARAAGRCRFWLFDLRGRHWATPVFDDWLGHDFAQAVHQTLGLPVFLACVLDADQRHLAESPGARRTQLACAAYGLYPYLFSNEADARDWLLYQQQFS